MSIRVVVVDDEPLARLGIRERLRRQADMEVVEECGNADQALAAIGKLQPDLLFLDINMPGISGMDLLRGISPEQRPCTIFLTAHEEHAVEAFDVEALDYLLKPVDNARFASCLAKVRRLFELKRQDSLYQRMEVLLRERTAPAERPTARRFAVREGSAVSFVETKSIDWIEGLGDYAGLHVGPRSHLVRESLNRLEKDLIADGFLRIHRSTIVQINRIVRLTSLSNRDILVMLRDGTNLRASRSYSAALQHALRSTQIG